MHKLGTTAPTNFLVTHPSHPPHQYFDPDHFVAESDHSKKRKKSFLGHFVVHLRTLRKTTNLGIFTNLVPAHNMKKVQTPVKGSCIKPQPAIVSRCCAGQFQK